MHDALFGLRGQLARPELLRAARGLHLDVVAVEAALDSGAHDGRIEEDLASGARSAVTGTPAFFAGREQISGAFDAGPLVEALRASA